MGWSNQTLGDYCEVIAGQSPEGKYYNTDGQGLPFYQGKKEFGDRFIGAPQKWTTKVTKEAIDGDILMSVRAPVGPINFSTQKICIGRGLASIRPSTKLNKDFLFYYLLSKQDEIVGNEGAVFASINKAQIEALSFSYVDITEQKRIVALLDTVFADLEQTRAKTEQNLKNARELMNVTFQEAITGKLTKLWREANQNVVSASDSLTQLKEQKNQFVNEKVISKEKALPRLSKEEAPYELPESWLWCRLGEIGNATNYPFVDGPFGSSINTKTDYIETGVPVLRMVNVKPFTYKNYNLKYVNEDKYQQFTRHNVLPGDVLFSKVGAGTGESCVVPDDFSYGMLSTTGITRIRVGQVVLNQYLCCFLNSNIKKFMILASKAAQPFLNMTQIKTFAFPLPPIEEQSEIIK